MTMLLWMAVVLLLAVGLAGTVLPALPGTAFILAGIVLAAWIDDFTRIGTGTLVVVGVIAVVSWVLDFVAGLLGAKRAGASREALIGAMLGTVLGLLMGLVGVLFMPLVGAVAGEAYARRRDANHRQTGERALKVGVATWLGMIAGMLAKVVLAFVMIGIFIGALLT
jgi:uncharacterized protein